MTNDQSRPQVKPAQQGGKPASGVLSRFLALEPRVLLDAAAVETVEQVAAISADDSGAATDDTSFASVFVDSSIVASPLAGSSGAREILFVDAGVDNYEALIRDLGAGVEVHVLQEGDWATQIQAVLGSRDGDVTAIHLVSHGGAGQFTLGGDTVNLASLDSYSRVWSAMQQALTPDGDLLVYGCDIAAGDAGAAFVQALADRTGADVAASADLSGVAALGGDWDLEVAVGDVDAQSLYAGGAAADFLSVLADGWVQDAEITAGTTSVAITHTTDGKDWKFVGTAASNKVDIYLRNTTTGVWGFVVAVTGNGSGNFGFDMAAAGNKLAVSAPNFDNGTNDGRVYVYSYNGTNWTTVVDTIVHRTATGSGQSNYQANVDNDNGNDQFGYSIDLAWDGATNYRLIVGNPNEDWWQTNWGTDGWGATSLSTTNIRYDAGVAHIYTAAGHTALFAFATQIESQQGGGTGNGHLFGGVVGATYDYDSANWWYAVGGDGLNAVRVYDAPGAGTIGGATFTQAFAWDSAGTNDVSMDDDYMVIANAASVQAYKLDAASTAYAVKGAAFGSGGAVVMVDDWDQSAAGDTTDGARLLYSAPTITYIADINASTGGNWVPWALINNVQETAVAIDRYYSIDMLTANATGARSYHYNWDPDVTNDTATTDEDTSVVTNVVANDTDINITSYGTVSHGDSLYVSAVSASAYGATVTFSTTSVTYNPTTSAYLRSLAVGQTAQETINVSISDGQGGTTIQTYTVTINGVNDVPYATALTPLSPYAYQQSGSTNAYDFSNYFSDYDSGEANGLVPSATALPVGWSAVADGSLLRVTAPSTATAGNYTITVRVQDAQGAFSATRNFVIAIDAANNAPFVQSAIPDQVALAGYGYGFTVPAETFGDPDPAPFDNITYTATLSSGAALPAWLTFDPVFRTFTGSPAAGDVGSITVRVTANDSAAAARGGPATVYDDFTLTIVNPTVRTLTAFTDGPAAGANFGFTTAISEDGSWLAVGAPSHNNYGSVWMYQWNGTGWTYITGLTPTTAAGSQVGWSIDLSADGTKMIIGARSENAGRGAAYCYTRAGSVFTLNGKLTANASTADDRFGSAVAINEAGTYVLIGASHFDYGGLTDSGAAFMAAFPAANGALTANVLPKDPAEFDLFGSSVAFDQNVMVVSAPRDDNAQGMLSRLAFDETGGNYTAPTFGSVGGTLNADAQFFYDGTRAEVVYLNTANASGMVNLSAPIDLGASWTISSWYKGLRTVGAGEWRTLTRGTSDHQIIVNDAGLLGVYDNAGGTGFVSSGYNMGALNNTVWHNIVAVGEGTSTKFYIDGVLVGTVGTEKPTDDVVVVGNYQGGGQRFSDYLDDFRVYDRALSQSEIRNIYSGTAAADAPYGDMGSIYVFSTDAGNAQVAKLYAPDGRTGDMVGWSLDLDIYDIGATSRQGGIIVASSIYNDDAATDGGAVYVWRSTSQASGTLNNGGTGNGTWILETKLTSFDTSAGDYFGSDVAVDYDESTGGTRLLVGSQFEDTNGAYSGAVYAYKFNTYTDVRDTAGSWVPEKFASAAPQGGSQTNSEFFGSSVAIADTRAVIGARWRDTGGQVNDGAIYWANLQTQGNYATLLSAETSATESFFLSADEMDVVALDTSSTQGTISFAADGRMVYTPGAAFKTLGVGQSATDTFTYLTERGGITYTNTVTVTVHGVDDGVQAANDVIQVSASSATLLNVLANDLAPDSVGLLSIRSLATADTVGRVYNTGGALVYDPAGRFDALAAGETVQELFAYTVTNSSGQTSTAYVTLMVVGEDDPVVATNDAVTVKADAVVTVNVLANDSDRDGAGTFSITAVDDSGALGSAVFNADGTISYLPGSAFRYLKAGETATDTIVYTVRDATGNESSALLVVTVVGVNDAPVAFNDGIAAGGGTTVAVDVLANDGDPDGNLRVARLITDGTTGNAVLNADGTISYTASAAGGLDKFSYEVIDSLGKSSIATVYVNHPDGVPGIGAVDDVAVTRGLAPVSIALTANDGGGAQVTSVDASGGVGSVALGDNGVLVYTPGESLAKLPAGTVYVDTVSYSVQYADGSVGAATLRVYVNGQYVAPTVEEEDEERFALAESTFLSGEVPVLLTVAAPSSADLAAPATDNVARMALAGMVEIAAADSAPQVVQPEEPVQLDLAAKQADVGKPGLSAALSREVLAKRAGVDALLRHFVDHAA